MFQKLIQALGPVDVDLFAFRLYHQIQRYISWQPDLHKRMVDTFLPSICSNRDGVSQSNEGKVHFEYNNSSMAFPTTVHAVFEGLYKRSNFSPPFPNPLTGLNQNQHPLRLQRTLALAV